MTINGNSKFTPVRKLDVFRLLSTGEKVAVGTLAQDSEYTYFAYENDYLIQLGNLSPFSLKADITLQIVIEKIVDSVAQFKQIAQQFDIDTTTIKLIEKQLNGVRKANQGLLPT